MAAREQTAGPDHAPAARELVAAVIEHGNDAVLALDREGVILSWNAAAERIFRIQAAEVVGTRFHRFVPVEREYEIDWLARELAVGRPVRRHRTVRLRADGERFLVELTLARTNAEDGRSRGYGVILRELAELDPGLTDAHLALLASVVQNTGDAVVTSDLEGRVLSWNPAAERLLGRTAAEMLGEPSSRLVLADDATEQDALARVARGETPPPYDALRAHKDGHAIPVSITCAPLRDRGGRVLGASAILRDRREQMRGQAAAAQLGALVKSSPDAIVAVDRQGQFTIWNPAAERLYGWPAAEMLGKPVDPLVPEGGMARAQRRLDDALAGRSVRRETQHRRADGSRVPLEVMIFPVRDTDGEVIGASMIARDVGERREAERVAARLAAVVDGVAEAIVGFDAGGRVMSWNPGAERLWGYAASEAMGLTAPDLVPRRMRAQADGLLERASRGEPMEVDTRVARKDGTETATHASIRPIFSPTEVIQGYSVCVRDMTARRAAERELERRAADLARMNADLETFAYAASHDLQEPLRVIRLAAEMLSRLSDDRAGEEGDMLVAQMMSSAERMSAQLDGLLALTRATPAGEGALKPVCADLALDDALAALRLTLEESGAVIEREPLPEVAVPRVQLAHVFQNLVANAVKFRDPSCVPVVRIVAEEAAGDTWRISVADNGIGIPDEHRERIFGVFARLHRDERYPGTGIGLPLCRKVVERHGGTIELGAGTGPGSTFVMTLPAHPPGSGS